MWFDARALQVARSLNTANEGMVVHTNNSLNFCAMLDICIPPRGEPQPRYSFQDILAAVYI